jgi:ubiquinol-cytochrome c reductase cytochrome b subunit
MFWAIAILVLLPIFDPFKVRSTYFKPFIFYCYVGFILIVLTLGWLGQEVVETPFIEVSQVITPFYFMYFLILIPFISNLERVLVESFNNYEF